MKKYLALILAAVILCAMIFSVTSCKKEPTSITTPEGEEIPLVDTGDIENTDMEHSAPGSSYTYIRSNLSLDREPVYADGKLTLNFTETLQYQEYTECYIGLRSVYEAVSVPAKTDMDAAVDMYNGDGAYTGIVLVPETPIDAGTYTVIVSIGTYIVDSFELTVE